jgi:hypothetical protein
MNREPSGWWTVVLAVLGVIIGLIQVWQGSTPRCCHQHTHEVSYLSWKGLGITFEHRVERDGR